MKSFQYQLFWRCVHFPRYLSSSKWDFHSSRPAGVILVIPELHKSFSLRLRDIREMYRCFILRRVLVGALFYIISFPRCVRDRNSVVWKGLHVGLHLNKKKWRYYYNNAGLGSALGRVCLGNCVIIIHSGIYSGYSAPGSRIAGMEIQVFRNENSSQTNAYSHYSKYSYSGWSQTNAPLEGK